MFQNSIEINKSKFYWIYYSLLFFIPLLFLIHAINENKVFNKIAAYSVFFILSVIIILIIRKVIKNKKPRILINNEGIKFYKKNNDYYFNWSDIDQISIELIGIRSPRKVIEIKTVKNSEKNFSEDIGIYDITVHEFKDYILKIGNIDTKINCY